MLPEPRRNRGAPESRTREMTRERGTGHLRFYLTLAGVLALYVIVAGAIRSREQTNVEALRRVYEDRGAKVVVVAPGLGGWPYRVPLARAVAVFLVLAVLRELNPGRGGPGAGGESYRGPSASVFGSASGRLLRSPAAWITLVGGASWGFLTMCLPEIQLESSAPEGWRAIWGAAHGSICTRCIVEIAATTLGPLLVLWLGFLWFERRRGRGSNSPEPGAPAS
jgi:hypothetical protein